MNRFLGLFLCVYVVLGFAGNEELKAQALRKKYYIQFKDKANSPYSISKPEEFLSQKAIQRRQRCGTSIVQNDIPVNKTYVNGIAALGIRVINRLKWFNGVITDSITSSEYQQILALPYVASGKVVQFKTKQEVVAPFRKKDLQFVESTTAKRKADLLKEAENFDYGAGLNQIQMMNGDLLHLNGFTGKGMVIAVLDAGFYKANELPCFDSLFKKGQVLGTWDFVDGNTSVYEDNNHGMNVLSTMGGKWPGNLVGTAPDASYWLLRSENAESEYIIEEYNWAAAAEFADSVGADVINSSLGYTEFDDPTQNHTYADMNGDITPCTRAADLAASKGILVVNSAGNEGGSGWHYIGAPADGDSVLAVGAVDPTRILAGFSSRGPASDGAIKPNVSAQGVESAVQRGNGEIGAANGTSFSSPITAGMCAALWQANPALCNMDIKRAVEQSASQAATPDSLLGYGIPDFKKAYFLATGKTLITYLPQTTLICKNAIFGNEGLICFVSCLSRQELRPVLYDMQGRAVIVAENVTVQPGKNSFKIRNTEQLPAGVYVLTLQGGNGDVEPVKVVKQ